jgi:hypothetical protein
MKARGMIAGAAFGPMFSKCSTKRLTRHGKKSKTATVTTNLASKRLALTSPMLFSPWHLKKASAEDVKAMALQVMRGR